MVTVDEFNRSQAIKRASGASTGTGQSGGPAGMTFVESVSNPNIGVTQQEAQQQQQQIQNQTNQINNTTTKEEKKGKTAEEIAAMKAQEASKFLVDWWDKNNKNKYGVQYIR